LGEEVGGVNYPYPLHPQGYFQSNTFLSADLGRITFDLVTMVSFRLGRDIASSQA
jgi:hypothetical protein